jgi:hypothetical protein
MSRGFSMEPRSPEAGMPIDKDMILVTKIHELLVGEFGARPIMLKFLVDSQRTNNVDGHYEAEYELKSGTSLKFMCKLVKKDMIFRVTMGMSQLNYAVDLDKFINDDLVPISIFDIKELLDQWMKA